MYLEIVGTVLSSLGGATIIVGAFDLPPKAGHN